MGWKWKTFIDDMIVIMWIKIEISQDDGFEVFFSSVRDEGKYFVQLSDVRF